MTIDAVRDANARIAYNHVQTASTGRLGGPAKCGFSIPDDMA